MSFEVKKNPEYFGGEAYRAPIFPHHHGVDVQFNGFVIEDMARETAQPVWFSILTAEKTAAAHGWTSEPGEALQFARRTDAEAFVRRYLPNMTVNIVGRHGR